MTAPPLTFVATPPFHVEQQLQLHQLLHSPHSVGVCVSVELLFCILQVLFSDAAALPGISQWQRRGRGLRHGCMAGWAWSSGLQIQGKLVSVSALELMKVSLEFRSQMRIFSQRGQ